MNGPPPFLSFLSGFDQHPSLEVLCVSINDTESWRSCVKEKQTPSEAIQIARELSSLRSKIVVVGEVSDEDMHGSVLGSIPIPGFLLQANFIEALLDDRYFGPACWADYLLGFVFFIVLELILAWEEAVWWVVFEIALLVLVTVACLFIAVLIFQVYINPVPVSATAVVVKLGILLSDRIQGKHTLKGDAPVHVARSLAYVAVTVLLISLWAVFCPGPRHIEGRAATVGYRPPPWGAPSTQPR